MLRGHHCYLLPLVQLLLLLLGLDGLPVDVLLVAKLLFLLGPGVDDHGPAGVDGLLVIVTHFCRNLVILLRPPPAAATCIL